MVLICGSAPEVILGLDPEYAIDIWSLGGVLAEMHTGYVLFQVIIIVILVLHVTSSRMTRFKRCWLEYKEFWATFRNLC